MKQHITKEQWDELKSENYFKLYDGMPSLHDRIDIEEFYYGGVNIGRMIEFLGEDFGFLEFHEAFEEMKAYWIVAVRINKEFKEYKVDNPTDGCWEACKDKLGV